MLKNSTPEHSVSVDVIVFSHLIAVMVTIGMTRAP